MVPIARDVWLWHGCHSDSCRCRVAVQNGDEEQLDDLRIHGSLQFISLKKLNRIAHFRSKKVRDATSDVSCFCWYELLMLTQPTLSLLARTTVTLCCTVYCVICSLSWLRCCGRSNSVLSSSWRCWRLSQFMVWLCCICQTTASLSSSDPLPASHC